MQDNLKQLEDSVSEDDLALLATPDAEIIERNQVFCFDEDEFEARMKSGDRWQQVIQAHLYFEHVVSQILVEAMPRPEAVSMSRMGLSQRLDLVSALDLLPDELLVCVRKINSLRNKIAQDLSFEISNDDVRDVSNCTPPHLRKAIVETASRVSGPPELHELVSVVVLMCDIVRQKNAARRALSKKSEVRLRTVLRKTPGARYVP